MKIYLAGGITGNLKPAWNYIAQVGDITTDGVIKGLIHEGFLVDQQEKGDDMRVYLADTGLKKAYCIDIIKEQRPYLLESFFYCDKVTEMLLPFMGDFMLDSGAFTFMENSKTHVEWEPYIEQYADFINRNNIEKFFELDIDSVVGYEKVLEYRSTLERLTGKQCIPVWHISRGTKEFLRHCDEYPYVALGGIVSKEWSPSAEEMMPWFIHQAHRRGTKIHGLGYTRLAKLKQLHFDSVDSTSWTTGNRFGNIWYFDGHRFRHIMKPEGMRLAKPREIALINFSEWIKFQRYADTNL